ncbi:hypothetical protein AAMO2058_000460700 [Amorphochlora amoebiformis]
MEAPTLQHSGREVVNKLTGIWSGWSQPVSRPEKRTLWERCSMDFTLNRSGKLLMVEGKGISVWRGCKTEFNLTGSLDLKTLTLDLSKQHTGKYTSSIRYKGTVDVNKATITGEYSRGVLHLKRTKALPSTSVSVSPSSRTKVSIKFSPVDTRNRKGWTPISATPISAERQRSSSGPPMITGVGFKRLDGIWEGESTNHTKKEVTVWKDCKLEFQFLQGNASFVKGTGVSIWRDREIPFSIEGTFDGKVGSGSLVKTHKGAKIRSSIAYAAAIDETQGRMYGRNEKSEFVLVRIKNPAPPPGLRTQGSRKYLVSGSRRLGIPHTPSTDRNASPNIPNPYSVDPTPQRVSRNPSYSIDNARFHSSSASGGGYLTPGGGGGWKRAEMGGRVEGETKPIGAAQENAPRENPYAVFSPSPPTAKPQQSFDKQFQAISPKGQYFAPPNYTHQNPATSQGSSGSYYTQASFGNLLVTEGYESPSGKLIGPEGAWGGGKGGGGTPLGGVSKVGGGPTMAKPSLSRQTSADRKTGLPSLDQYRAFLQGLVSAKKLKSDQLQALAQFREKHQITTEEHLQTLKDIGLTKEIFEEMKLAEDIDDKELCKICFDREMNCALIPCGHTVCLTCSKILDVCPNCREPFTRVQKLFRS